MCVRALWSCGLVWCAVVVRAVLLLPTWPVTEEMAKTGVTRSEAMDAAAASTWLICQRTL